MAFPQRRVARTASLPSPIGGWNARDSLAEMNAIDAVEMVNFFPTPTDILMRKGYSQHSGGITGSVDTLMNYAGPTSQTLFAVANGVIYNTATSTATSVYTGLSNSRLQHANFTNSAGDPFLSAVNGQDPALLYNGTSWIKTAATSTAQTISTITRGGTGNLTATLTTASAHGLVTGNQVTISGTTESNYNGTYIITVTGSTTFTYVMATAPAADASVVGSYTVNFGITGVNSNTFININVFKERLFYVEKNSMNVWYLGTKAVSGTASKLDFGSVAKMGGYIQAMGTWTIDAGQGVDDYAVFVTNMGEVIVYEGTDPSDVTKWALRGVWQLGQTFTRRCFAKFGGDLLLITQEGLVPLASALQSSRLDPRVNLTDKIYGAFAQATSLYSTNFGWEIQYFPKANMLIVNIPTNTSFEQYVMNNITKSWARFTGVQATNFEIHNENIYFGSNGFVGKFWDTFADNGNVINATVQQSYNYFDSRGQNKRFTLVRPIFLTDNGLPSVFCAINTDFDTQSQLGQVSFNPSALSVGLWDVGDWDDNFWGGTLAVNKDWQGVSGIGYCASISLNVASKGIEVHWASTDFVMEAGGVI
jgi:hypothetical protein